MVTRLVKFANCASLFAIFLEKWSLAQKDRVHLVRQERVTSDVHAVDAISNFGSLTFVFLKRALPSKEKRCRSAIRFSVSNFRSLTFVFLKRPISSLYFKDENPVKNVGARYTNHSAKMCFDSFYVKLFWWSAFSAVCWSKCTSQTVLVNQQPST